MQNVLSFFSEKIMANINPIAYIIGDDTVAKVGKMIRNHLNIPCTLIDLSVENRLSTEDGCIEEAVDAIKLCGTGFKESTASDDVRIKAKKMKSANILLRPAMGGYGMARILLNPKTYQKPCGVFRYGHGGIYDVKSHKIENYPQEHALAGEEYIVEQIETNLSGLILAADKAAEIAQEYGFKLFIASKWTIAPFEKIFMDRVTSYWSEKQISYEKRLTDTMMANLPPNTMGDGEFLVFFLNEAGDSGSDVIDVQDGSRSMTSTVYCRGGFCYEELPGGTAPTLLNTDLCGENFFNPYGSINGMVSSVITVNPAAKVWGADVSSKAKKYLAETPNERSTEKMISVLPEFYLV